MRRVMHDPPFLLASLTQPVPLHTETFKRDVRGDFELNPKEIRLIPLLLPVADKREHEKEHACLPRSLHRLGRRLKDELP